MANVQLPLEFTCGATVLFAVWLDPGNEAKGFVRHSEMLHGFPHYDASYSRGGKIQTWQHIPEMPIHLFLQAVSLVLVVLNPFILRNCSSHRDPGNLTAREILEILVTW